jgi:preprotein translocase subunit SecA
MGLYEKWDEIAGQERSQEEYDNFWQAYFESEMKVYENILQNKQNVIEGKLSEIAAKYNMEPEIFVGFISGINTSLINEVEVESLSEDSDIKLEIDYEKLYFNMLAAKAEWLYGLKQWDDILTVERRKEIKKEYNISQTVVKEEKIGRNDPCPCGSGKKYKKCCGK